MENRLHRAWASRDNETALTGSGDVTKFESSVKGSVNEKGVEKAEDRRDRRRLGDQQLRLCGAEEVSLRFKRRSIRDRES